jgi:triosephosphate isomerase
MRTPVIAGNWKMNPPTLEEATALALAVRQLADELPDVTTVVCPPTIWLPDVARAARGGRLRTGAQTMHFEEKGAFTGETSPLMLRAYADFVILGHSERRQFEGETDERVGRKVASAVAHGLRPIAAVGETAEQRRAGTGLVVAYEPVWAIGTGDAASPEDAQEVAAQIRAILSELDPAGAEEIPIQYGGSCTADNAAELFALPDIDGALVGGASLKADAFGGILRAAADRVAA